MSTFDLYDDNNNYILTWPGNSNASNIPVADLVSGSTFSVIDGTQTITIQSNGICNTSLTLTVPYTTPTVTISWDVAPTLGGSTATLKAVVVGGLPNYTYTFNCYINSGGSCIGISSSPTILTTSDSVVLSTINWTGGFVANYSVDVTVQDSQGNSDTSNALLFNACLVPNTVISMFDGSKKEIKDIKVGDELLTIVDSNFVKSVVTGKSDHFVDETLIINNGVLISSNSHIHLIRKENSIIEVIASALKVGDTLIGVDKDITINSLEIDNNYQEVVNISTDIETYIANGVLTHNKNYCNI